jgi:hypothetical protein
MSECQRSLEKKIVSDIGNSSKSCLLLVPRDRRGQIAGLVAVRSQKTNSRFGDCVQILEFCKPAKTRCVRVPGDKGLSTEFDSNLSLTVNAVTYLLSEQIRERDSPAQAQIPFLHRVLSALNSTRKESAPAGRRARLPPNDRGSIPCPPAYCDSKVPHLVVSE